MAFSHKVYLSAPIEFTAVKMNIANHNSTIRAVPLPQLSGVESGRPTAGGPTEASHRNPRNRKVENPAFYYQRRLIP